MTQPKQKILAYLKSRTEITDLVGNRIWAGHREPPKEAEYKPADGPAITIANDGGQGNYNHNIVSPRFMFRCFGSDEVEVNDLYDAVESILFDLDFSTSRAAHNIFSMDLESGPIDGHLSDVDWPHVLFFCRARMIARR